ncbi:MAG: hypothetical protein JXB35_01315 [Anaerolineae bacterium]|nr:hypothetical protein [Anaerolineae bacterium]
MIAYKSFTAGIAGFTAKITRQKMENLREEARAFVNQTLEPDQLINIAETCMDNHNLFAVTVWYRKDAP